ncbi:transcription factor NAI1-like isoform X1 [Hordeum vulgare subsp. vulgare]|nr:transcription factor NAI1-like isoform X1 [Hordeum vulgare subsp. vulgare]
MLHELGQWRRTDLMGDMDDSLMFMQWAVSTLQHQDEVGTDGGGERSACFPCLQALRDSSELVEAQNSTMTSSDDTGGGGGIISPATDAAVHQGSWSPASPTSGGPFAPSGVSSTGITNTLSMSWNFGGVLPLPPPPVRSGGGGNLAAGAPLRSRVAQPTRGASTKGTPHAQDHIMAERKRREKINQRFIELSAVIPGLKKMDKGTILTDATRYVKELQERVRSLEAAGGNHKSVETAVLVRKPCRPVAPDDGEGSARFLLAAGTPEIRSQLPEIEAKLSEDNVMVRIHCEMNGKGLFARVLAEVEELHLRIVQNSVMPFTSSTVIITTMAKVEKGFTINTEEIVERLNYALYQLSLSNSSGNNNY